MVTLENVWWGFCNRAGMCCNSSCVSCVHRASLENQIMRCDYVMFDTFLLSQDISSHHPTLMPCHFSISHSVSLVWSEDRLNFLSGCIYILPFSLHTKNHWVKMLPSLDQYRFSVIFYFTVELFTQTEACYNLLYSFLSYKSQFVIDC